MIRFESDEAILQKLRERLNTTSYSVPLRLTYHCGIYRLVVRTRYELPWAVFLSLLLESI
jgi:hypothetical protein